MGQAQTVPLALPALREIPRHLILALELLPLAHTAVAVVAPEAAIPLLVVMVALDFQGRVETVRLTLAVRLAQTMARLVPTMAQELPTYPFKAAVGLVAALPQITHMQQALLPLVREAAGAAEVTILVILCLMAAQAAHLVTYWAEMVEL